MTRWTHPIESVPKPAPIDLISDGTYHNRVTLALVIPSGIFGALLPVPLPVGEKFVLAMIGCVLALIMNPDLDQEGITSAESFWLRVPIIGVTLMGLWIAIWGVYARLFKHRGVSHTPIVGTLTRVVYLAFEVYFLYFASYYLSHHEIPNVSLSWTGGWVVPIVVGLMIADTGHYVRDQVVSRQNRNHW